MCSLWESLALGSDPVLYFGLCDASLQGYSGHAQVPRHLGGELTGVDQASGVIDLAIGEPLPLDFQLHLRHDGEDHQTSRHAGAHVAASQI